MRVCWGISDGFRDFRADFRTTVKNVGDSAARRLVSRKYFRKNTDRQQCHLSYEANEPKLNKHFSNNLNFILSTKDKIKLYIRRRHS